jgi:hypothetical protein
MLARINDVDICAPIIGRDQNGHKRIAGDKVTVRARIRTESCVQVVRHGTVHCIDIFAG